MTRSLLIIFAREPGSENVKTRLSALLTADERARFYEAMLTDALAAGRRSCSDRRIVQWAGEAEPFRLEQLLSGEQLVPQRGGDLGERMKNAMEDATAAVGPPGVVVLIGSDAPLITAEIVDQAFDALAGSDVVLGPANDGGYYLIGVRGRLRGGLGRIFDGLPWSTPSVVSDTVRRLSSSDREPALSYELLPMLHDVDTPDDYRRLCRHLVAMSEAGQPVPRHTYAFIDSWTRDGDDP